MDRFLWAASGDKRRLRLADLCQFTLRGVLMINCGTEVGLSQKRGIHQVNSHFGILEESRLPMPWGREQDGDLLWFYQGLIHPRRTHPAQVSGQWESLLADPHALAYSWTDDQ